MMTSSICTFFKTFFYNIINNRIWSERNGSTITNNHYDRNDDAYVWRFCYCLVEEKAISLPKLSMLSLSKSTLNKRINNYEISLYMAH